MADEQHVLRVLLPNKERTAVQVANEDVMLDVFKQICEKRQMLMDDFVLQYETGKKKLDDVDLTLQFQQCCANCPSGMLTEVVVTRVKRKLVLLPASSRAVNLRRVEEAPPPVVTAPPSPDLLGVPGGSGSSGSIGRSSSIKKTRMRSISMSLRDRMGLGGSAPRLNVPTGAADGAASPHDQPPSPGPFLPSGSMDHLPLMSSMPSLSTSTPSVSTSSSRDSPVAESPDAANSVPAINVEGEVPVEPVEKISVGKEKDTKMTLTRKALRPRSSTVSMQSMPSLVDPKPDEDVLLRISLGANASTMLKVSPNTTMETILHEVCTRKNLNFEDYSIDIPERPDVQVDLDRPLKYYNLDPPFVRIFQTKEKSYSSMAISEGDRDVLIFNYVLGRLEVSQATELKLVERLTDEQDRDKRFCDTLMLTYRSFMSPEDLFDLLMCRFNAEPPENPTEDELRYYVASIDKVRRRVFEVLYTWMDKYWHDFVFSEELRQALDHFLEEIKLREERYPYWAEYRPMLEEKISEKSGLLDLIFNVPQSAPAPTTLPADSPLAMYKSFQIAEQLCLFDSKLFSNCAPIEFVNMIYRTGDEKLYCPNLSFFIEHFNRESMWAVFEVVDQADINKRIHTLNKFIKIARRCAERNNLFSAFAIMTGLNMTPVQRLKKTWAGLPSATRKMYDELEKLIDPSKNMQKYRETIGLASPPLIPFLPIFIKDLTFLKDGNPSRINGLINFDKLRMMADKVNEMIAWSAVPYTYEVHEDIQRYIKNPPFMPLDKLLAVADLYEPREVPASS